MKKFYTNLIKEVEMQRELTPANREKIWENLGKGLDFVSAKAKRIQLELNCLKKVEKCWEGTTPISPNLQDLFRTVLNAICANNQETLEKSLPEFYGKCDAQLKDTSHFYEDYLKQSIVYLMMILKDVPFEKDTMEDLEMLRNGDLEFNEWDTSYCACMMWTYRNIASQDSERKKRELEFWDWYIKEAAKLQDITIKTKMKIPKDISVVSVTEINTIEDFVKFISYEFDYIKYEKKEDRLLLIYVINLKDGADCTECGQFSNHIESSVSGFMPLGDIMGWTIRFDLTVYDFYCDNPKCSLKDFHPKNKVTMRENVSNFLYLKSIPKMQEKIWELFDLDDYTHGK